MLRSGMRSILLSLMLAVVACAGLARAESGSISHGPNSISYSVSG